MSNTQNPTNKKAFHAGRLSHKVQVFLASSFLWLLMGWLQPAHSQFFVWTDKVAVTTSSQDSLWTGSDMWYDLAFYSDSVAILYKLGAPDTTSWYDRPWMYLPAGTPVSIGPSTGVRRLEFKASAGTGNIYFIGRKRKRFS